LNCKICDFDMCKECYETHLKSGSATSSIRCKCLGCSITSSIASSSTRLQRFSRRVNETIIERYVTRNPVTVLMTVFMCMALLVGLIYAGQLVAAVPLDPWADSYDHDGY
jgi:hypothetical protein